ncbi:MAG: DNA polymerase III subunit gamma/tau [Alphaproteobacteria bacterium]|nr:DNA polymerase III subunit gamma/tau [Alphaproteobacteria bacterium]
MATGSESTAYRVLARKYRPSNFSELVGQDALVRTLTNAIESGRIAQAYMLTGVRGVGKTTTARIIARALNCTGADGKGGITASPCGVCDNCVAIAEDRHVDVMEMDAASRTGIDDIRELIEGVRYKPVSARFKVYIIDEIHMLSKNAFNALLKTLEEPPEHIRFVFATTEIRKVPVTVLSRCQRFDLRRLDAGLLAAHFTAIAERERIPVEPEAIRLIARAADGSVRDGLSLLDQAIALGSDRVAAAQVQEMLGLADRTAVFALFDRLMAGEIKQALDQMQTMYRDGADPAAVLQDLLDVTYWVTRIKIAPEVADAPYTPEAERTHGREMAQKLSMPVLTRAWQLLLKGLEETLRADAQLQAAEMVLVRLAYAADLPPATELAKELAAAPTSQSPPPGTTQAPPPGPRPSRGGNGGGNGGPAVSAAAAMATPAPAAAPGTSPAKTPQSFLEVIRLFEENREVGIKTQLHNSVHLVKFEQGRIELRPTEHAPRDLASKTMTFLEQWTGMRWVVSISQERGDPTLAEQDDAARQRLMDAAERLPVVQAVKESFPGAVIRKVTPRTELAELESDAMFLDAPDAAEDDERD